MAIEDAPVLDGDLDDPCWADAPAIGELVMVEPIEGRRPTHDTVVKLLHDRDHLYVALRCDDAEPTSIRATQRARDARLDPDDRVEILFDTFENRRIGYFFQIGAGGSIGDGLASANGSRFDKPWDTIWDGRAKVTARGWQAELAIPFRSIPRRPGSSDWGFNVRRLKRSPNEIYQWANPTQSVPFFRVSELGRMTGLGEVADGVGVDVVPFALLNLRRDRTAENGDVDADPDAGGDLFWRVTPQLTLAATFFTDFAETENDDRQINLDRFPLFFPEKRDFFLEGASYFAFGPPGNDVLPFFSRRIGLARDGTAIPLLAGLKATGEIGRLGIGILGVETDPGDETRSLAVARLRWALAQQTAIGLIGTSGRPEEDGRNTVAGADVYHRVPRLVGDLDLQVFASALFSQTSGEGDGHQAAIDLRSRGREWEFGLAARSTSPDYHPELGFVRRRGVREYSFDPRILPRFSGEGALRNLELDLRAQMVEDWSGDTQEVDYGVDFAGVQAQHGDRAGVFWLRAYDRVSDFTLFRGEATIAAGEYWNNRYGALFASSDGRDFGVGGRIELGDFFDGESRQTQLDVDWRTGALLHLGVGWQTADVDLGPGRSFAAQIGQARIDLHLDPQLSLRNFVQYDNESRQLAWQSRLRWIYAPGRDFFAVLGLGWQREDDDTLAPTRQDVVFKVVHTMRF